MRISAIHICSCTSAFLRLSAYEYEGAAKVRGTKEYSYTSLKHAVHTIRREKGSVFMPVEAKKANIESYPVSTPFFHAHHKSCLYAYLISVNRTIFMCA